MNEKNEARFQGLVLAKLSSLEERTEDILRHVRQIETRCIRAHARHAALAAEVDALHERTNFNTRIIWNAVAWIVVSAVGTLLAILGLSR